MDSNSSYWPGGCVLCSEFGMGLPVWKGSKYETNLFDLNKLQQYANTKQILNL